MIDYTKIEEFKLLEASEGKLALEAYGLELGVTLKRSLSFPKMVVALETAVGEKAVQVLEDTSEVAKKLPEEISPVDPDVSVVETAQIDSAEVDVQAPIVEENVSEDVIETDRGDLETSLKEEIFRPLEESSTSEIATEEAKMSRMSFELTGEQYPWAWNMHNIQNLYWYGHVVESIDPEDYVGEWMVQPKSEESAYIAKLIKSSRMYVILRDQRSDNFFHITPRGLIVSRNMHVTSISMEDFPPQ